MSETSHIEAAAAQWLMRREQTDWSAADEAQFQAWLNGSYACKAAYWRLERGWKMADRLGSLGGTSDVRTRAKPPIRPRRWLAIAASIAATMVVTPVILHLSPPETAPAPTVHASTPVGGRERLALADGSTIELHTATLIRSAVSRCRRDVWLDEGEAFFSVAHSTVPFIVHAGSRTVTVLGTKFAVRRDGDRVRVAVVEGKVRISDANISEPSSQEIITRGQLLQAEGSATLVVREAAARVERSLAWRDGLLRFDRTPLSEAAREFNRYNERRLVVDGSAAAIPIGGSFRTSNAEAFARLLHEAYGLHVEYLPQEIKISA